MLAAVNPLHPPVLVFVTALALGAAGAELSPAEKVFRTPVTIYPNFAVCDTSLVAIFNGFAREDDALVVSQVEAFKSNFRVANLGVTRGQLWIAVSAAAHLGQTYRKNIEGARGLVYVPAQGGRAAPRYAAGLLAEEAKSLRLPLIVGLDERDTWLLANVTEIAGNGDVITICASRELRGPTPEFRHYLARVIRVARETNPTIKVELALIARREKAERAQMLKHAVGNIDLADRLAIYCDRDEESLESLKALLVGLRSKGI